MNLIGRYERLREVTLGTNQYGPALLFDRKEFDRKRDPLSPYTHSAEWWRSPSGLWCDVRHKLYEQKGALSAGNALVGMNGPFGTYADSMANYTTGDFTTAYTAGSAGIAMGAPMAIPETATLDSAYFYVENFHGTRANVNDLNLEIRPDTSGSPDTSSLLTSATVDPSGFASGWHRFASLSYSFAGATLRWVIIGDADGGATDYVTLRYGLGFIQDNARGWNFPVSLVSSTSNGWTTKSTPGYPFYICLAFANGMSMGWPAGTTISVSSNTLQRGALFTGGLTSSVKIWGLSGQLAIAGNPTGSIYTGSGGPNSGAVATGTLGTRGGTSTNITGVMLSAPYTIPAVTTQRYVLKGSSNSTIFNAYKTGTVNAGSASDLIKAFPGQGNWTYTEEKSGSPNDWGNDVANSYCPLSFFMYDLVSSGGGGGGTGSGLGAIITG